MNLSLSIFFFILLVIFALPIFTPKSIYFIYLLKKEKNEEIKETEKMKNYKNLLFAYSVIVFVILMFFAIMLLSTGIYLQIVMAFFIVIPFFKLLLYLLFDRTKIIDFPKQITLLNSLFTIVICIISIIIVIFGQETSDKVKNSIANTTHLSIENYANDNDYIIFPEKISKLTSEIGNDYLMVNNTKTHYLFIDGTDENSNVVVYDKVNSSNSFESQYDHLFELDNKVLETKYSDILDNIYLGSNYAPICYLVNKEKILLVYGLAEKNDATNEFFVSKYVIFDMPTGSLSEL